jgi:S-adenosylmethionine:tRNA ribosyltransferase-isomerase
MSFDFLDYELPPHLIAQEPCPRRDESRLLVVRRQDASLAHCRFRDLPGLLAPGDLLVLNDTRVVPARLLGRRAHTGGKWEGLFLRQLPGGTWELMTRSGGRLTAGEEVEVEPGPLRLCLRAKTPEGRWLAEPSEPGPAFAVLQRHGHVPLPPYIRKGRAGAADGERYQTVYARRAGAVAAPTAGLHFTPAVFEALAARGIDRAFVTLHVGPGTFQPIQAEDVTDHRMHAEWGELPEATARAAAGCKERGGRVVAVGTTSVRVLETAAAARPLRPWSGETELFIYPPYAFRAVDALVTNFHLPRSTLLLLVAAFAGVDLLRRAYRTAIDEGYRFYSYGDAMLLL